MAPKGQVESSKHSERWGVLFPDAPRNDGHAQPAAGVGPRAEDTNLCLLKADLLQQTPDTLQKGGCTWVLITCHKISRFRYEGFRYIGALIMRVLPSETFGMYTRHEAPL